MRKKLLLLLSVSLLALLAQAQNVGIGTTSPLARLHVSDSSVLFSGPSVFPPFSTTIKPPVQGAGTRMFWFPVLGAFRAGYVDGVQWDRDSIGLLSFAAGYNTKAKGSFSTSMGRSTIASNAIATSMGFGTNASGQVSTSMGNGSAASGFTATSMGNATLASGDFSTSMGDLTVASGVGAFASGGSSIASGGYASSLGEQTVAKARGGFTTGVWNDNTDAPNATTTASTDRIFQIGNGTSSVRSNAFTVLRNGNTGIGIIDPLFKLDMKGRMLLRGDGNLPNSPGVIFTNLDGSLYTGMVGSRGDSLIGFYGTGNDMPNNGWGLLMNTNNGRVGIGKDNPLASLHIAGISSYLRPDIWLNSTGPGNSANTIRFASPAAQGAGWNITAYTYPDLNNSSFWIYRNVDSTGGLIFPAMIINSNGIGIGNVYPNAPLQFVNTSANRKIVLYEDVNNDHQFFGLGIGNNTMNYQVGSPVASHVFYAGSGASSSVELMRIKGNGNVGIGTATPDFPISLPNTLGDKISLWGTSGPHYGFGIQGGLMQIHSATTVDDIAFGYGSSSSLTERARIINNGEFGMSLTGRMQLKTGEQSAGLWFTNSANTSNIAFAGMRSDTEVGFFGQTGTPGWRFYVNTTNGNAVLQGTLMQNSDMRLKKNIQPLSNTLSHIVQLNGYSYNWKDDNADPSLQIGLLAQELQKVYPQLVKENDKGMLSVNYNGMIPVLLEAIKEQQLIIQRQQLSAEKQQNIAEKQQAEINELKKMMQQLINK